jgi:hypothetical protein
MPDVTKKLHAFIVKTLSTMDIDALTVPKSSQGKITLNGTWILNIVIT